MNIEYAINTNPLFAQAYGTDSYGTSEYGHCQQTDEGCVAITTAGAPNTGFLGLTPDAAIASGAGALLVAVAFIGAFTVLKKRRSQKNKEQE